MNKAIIVLALLLVAVPFGAYATEDVDAWFDPYEAEDYIVVPSTITVCDGKGTGLVQNGWSPGPSFHVEIPGDPFVGWTTVEGDPSTLVTNWAQYKDYPMNLFVYALYESDLPPEPAPTDDNTVTIVVGALAVLCFAVAVAFVVIATKRSP